jgi:hypothetical protein
MTHIVTRFIHAFWLGSGAFLIMVAAPAAFRAAPSPNVAADVVGAMLTRWHYIGLAAPLALLALDWRRARMHVLAIVFIAVILAAAQAVVDLRIRKIRASTSVPISQLARQDPVRRHFGMLHGVSSLLLLGQVVCAGAALAMDKDYRRGAPVSTRITPLPSLPDRAGGLDSPDRPAAPESALHSPPPQ